jgi:hypothetical protein
MQAEPGSGRRRRDRCSVVEAQSSRLKIPSPRSNLVNRNKHLNYMTNSIIHAFLEVKIDLSSIRPGVTFLQ